MKSTGSFPPRPTALASSVLREVIVEGDIVIDATAGNGHDTMFLAECVGPGGRVLAFDLQENAIRSAREKAEKAGFGDRVEFFHTSHGQMADHAGAETVAAVMFNLGYLPGDDHALTTRTPETIVALDAAATLLKPHGALSVLCYPGHPEGATEAAAVEAWMTLKSTDGWRVAKYELPGTLRPAPFLLLAGKR